MTRWVIADRLFDGNRIHEDAAIGIEQGRVVDLRPAAGVAGERLPGRALLSPGYFDIQVNGGGGVLFNAEPTPEGLRAIARAHRALGTTELLPTLITDAPDVMEEAADAVIEVAGEDGVAGIHLEGPHISEVRRGTHAARHVRPFDARTMQVVRRLRDADVPVLITLAPEAVAPGDIAALVATGARVALGHSDAGFDAATAAVAEGATLFTHLFNAMSQMQGRQPGMVGAGIMSRCWCSAIFDGHHVHPAMLRLACSAKPVPDRMIMVSDAMPTVGGGDAFSLYGRRIELRDGRLVNDEGALAGAHVSMAGSVAFAVGQVGIPLEEALRMAISGPHELMGTRAFPGLTGYPVERLIVLAPDLVARPFDPSGA